MTGVVRSVSHGGVRRQRCIACHGEGREDVVEGEIYGQDGAWL